MLIIVRELRLRLCKAIVEGVSNTLYNVLAKENSQQAGRKVVENKPKVL